MVTARRRTALASAGIAAVTLCAVTATRADDWTQFRGGPAAGVVDAELPVVWGASNGVTWKAKLPGVGWSQPVVWGGKIFVTTAESDDEAKPDPKNMSPGFGNSGLAALFTEFQPPKINVRLKVLCLNAATGDMLWEKTARDGRPASHIHPNNTYATESPVTDGARVIASFGMNGLYSYDLDGNLVWKKDLGAYPTQFGWGTGSSLAMHDGLVFVQCDNDKASFLAAFDAATGDERWRVERDELSNWATPFIWKNKVRTELVAAGGKRMRSYDPRTGDLLWEMAGYGRTATTPAGDDGLLFVDSYDRLTGTTGVLAAIRPGASGDVSLADKETSNDYVAWSLRFAGNRMASPLVYKGCLYVLDNRGGVVRCLDAATGAEHYHKRVPGASGFVASPWAAGDRVYCLDQDGRTSVLKAGPKLEVEASNELEGMCWGSAAVAGDRLLIRTVEQLYCIGE
jgi:outer membrane protein assembly factor BamB